MCVSVVCVFIFPPIFLNLSPLPSPCLFRLPSLFAELWFPLLVSGLSFLSPLSFVYFERFVSFFPTVQLLTETLRVMNAIARLNIRKTKKGGARPAGLARVCEIQVWIVSARSSSSPPSLSPFTRNDGDHDNRRFCEAAGCLRADIFLLHI